MSTLTANDNATICRVRLEGEGRWVSLAISLGELDTPARFLVLAKPFVYEMDGVDEAARQYGLANWQGGVVSGARYAFRASKVSFQSIVLHELRGQLSSDDVWAVSSSAAVAVVRLLGRPANFPLDLGGWTITVEVSERRTGFAESMPQGEEGHPTGFVESGENGTSRNLSAAPDDSTNQTGG